MIHGWFFSEIMSSLSQILGSYLGIKSSIKYLAWQKKVTFLARETTSREGIKLMPEGQFICNCKKYRVLYFLLIDFSEHSKWKAMNVTQITYTKILSFEWVLVWSPLVF
jgi:hypothetical protein